MNKFKEGTLAYDVWNSKYRYNNESYDGFITRLYNSFKFEEEVFDEKKLNELSLYGKSLFSNIQTLNRKIFNKLHDLTIIPGGSVLASAGTDKLTSLSNCFVCQTDDSMEAIMNTARDMSEIYKRRGGVGLDLSVLRPNGAKVSNSNGTSTGVVPFMELYSQITQTVASGNRRGALLLSLDIKHPDALEFIRSKQDLTKITGANISIKVDKEFMDAVKNDKDYIQTWPIDQDLSYFTKEYIDGPYNELIYLEDHKRNNEIFYVKKIKAKELWDEFIKCSHSSAEPGLLFWDKMTGYSLTDVYPEFRTISTNPCQPSWATVLTKDGIRTFDDINIGDEIWSSEGWTKITNKQCSGEKDVYEYRTSSGSFIGTENHRILSHGEKIEVKDAESIDCLSGCDNGIEKLDSQDIMDGLVLGDGLYYKASKSIYLCIGQNDQDYFNSEIKDLIYGKVNDNKSYTYYVKTSIKLNEMDLIYNRSIPDRFINSNSKTIKGLLKGLYSANGSIVSKRITYKTSSKTMRDQIQLLLSSIGIRSYYTTNKPSIVRFSNGTYTCKESYDINISTDRKKFYEQIGFIQKYKMDKLNNIIEGVVDKVKTYNIISSNLISHENVYNITVDNSTHTYWTGGVNVSNCGEIPLSPLDSCRLIAVNLYNLIENKFTKNADIKDDTVYETFYLAQLMGDKLIDLELNHVQRIIDKTSGSEKELWKKIYEVGKSGRRTGVGFTALGDMYASLLLEYGHEEVTKRVMSIMMQAELDATIDLAILHGTFPSYNKNYELDGNDLYNVIRDEFPFQYKRMMKWGRRNISFSTVAPTGSLSILCSTSSGVEPQFSLYYNRRKKCLDGEIPDFVDQNGVGFKTYPVIAGAFEDWLKYKGYWKENIKTDELDKYIEESPWYKQCANDLNWKQRVNTQALIQRYITHSISSTVNTPFSFSIEDTSKLYMTAYESGLKGITQYRDGCRAGILIKNDSSKENEESKKQQLDYIVPKSRDEIGQVLNGQTYKFNTACGTLYVTINRDEDGNFVEIFTNSSKNGTCKANLNGQTRMASLALRSGVKLGEVIDQLKGIHCQACVMAKAKNKSIDGTSCPDIIAKALQNAFRRRLLNNEDPNLKKQENINLKISESEICPDCGSKLEHVGGCVQCSCGYSKCG